MAVVCSKVCRQRFRLGVSSCAWEKIKSDNQSKSYGPLKFHLTSIQNFFESLNSDHTNCSSYFSYQVQHHRSGEKKFQVKTSFVATKTKIQKLNARFGHYSNTIHYKNDTIRGGLSGLVFCRYRGGCRIGAIDIDFCHGGLRFCLERRWRILAM